MPEPTRIPPGDLQRHVWEQHPKADLFEIIGRWADSSFRGITFTTGRSKWWWAAVDGTIAPEPLPTRSDAADGLDEHHVKAARAANDYPIIPPVVEARYAVRTALKTGRALSEEEADTLIEALAKEEKRAGWREGYEQARHDATTEA